MKEIKPSLPELKASNYYKIAISALYHTGNKVLFLVNNFF